MLNEIIEKIKKLRTLSQNNSNVEEAATAARLADQLIVKHRIEEAQLEIDSNVASSATKDEQYIYTTGRIIPWKQSLAVSLADHYGCAIYNNTSYPEGRQVSNLCLIGRKSDMEITRYMFAWLSLEIDRLCKLNCKGFGKIYCQSYCIGAVSGIKQQLALSKQQIKDETLATQSVALVKLDDRKSEAEQALIKLVPELKPTKATSKSQYDPDGYYSGVAAGKNINLHKNLNSGSNNKILGE